jgi:hypothetical protein
MIQEIRAVDHAAKVPTGSTDAAGVVALRARQAGRLCQAGGLAQPPATFETCCGQYLLPGIDAVCWLAIQVDLETSCGLV